MKIANDKVLSRIRKLLALSTSSNVNEAATAAAAAQRLMFEHKLSEADVSDSESSGQMFELSMGAAGFASRWKFVLVVAVAQAFFCEAIGLRIGRQRKVRLIGLKEDVEAAASVFRYLLKEINRLARQELEDPPDEIVVEMIYDLHDSKLYVESFRRGAVMAVAERLRQGEKEFVASEAKALVVVKGSRTRVREYIETKFRSPRKVRLRTREEIDELALSRGYRQAQDIVVPLPGPKSSSAKGSD